MKSFLIFAMGISLFSATSYATFRDCKSLRTFDAYYGNLKTKQTYCEIQRTNALVVEERSPSWKGYEPREGEQRHDGP